MIDLTRWPQADQILDEALALPEVERVDFLRRAAAGDVELLAALQAVVAEAARDDQFLTPGGALSGTLGHEVAEELVGADDAAHVLEPGSRVEHYEIVGLIGRGGMGEVYRARDTRLHRDVALKVLPTRFAREPGRIARFQREARTLASLSHSGIGAIYGVAEQGDVEALVLELVEGPTLAARLRTKTLSLDEALRIGRRLAEAIEAAHVRGILHRDLKPANIKVATDGTVKILDFGLAKALAPEPIWPQADDDLTGQSPGIVLGTPAYMSPEQVRGEPADERSDIWAFGCVLFEMLAGARAFPGASATEVMARVLERDPAFDALPSSTPASIRRLLRRALEKNPRRRLGHIGDAILEFDDATIPDAGPKSRFWTVRYAALVATGIGVGVLGSVLVLRSAAPERRSVARFLLPLPTGDTPVTGFQPMVALSPDGRTLVYRARRNGVTQLFRRDLRDLDPEPIAGTENATGPFFSPDGGTLGFDSDGVLKRVALDGGPPVVICPAPGGATATWMPDDSIVFATNTNRVLQRVPASGGTPVALTALDQTRGDTLHLLPQALPDGQTLLFTIVSGAGRHIALRLASGETRVIAQGTHGRYLPDGYLVFSREGSLWGVRFDLDRGAMSGNPVPLVEGIEHTDNTVLHFASAAEGSIAYLPAGQNDGSVQRLVWFDRRGRETPVNLEPGPYTRVSLSPDGNSLALTLRARGNTDVWVADLVRRTMSRLTFEPTIETMPTWSPDGKTIAFRSEREGPGIFVRDAQGAGPVERLTATDGPIHSPYSWTPDSRTLLLAVFRSFRHQAVASVTPPDLTVRVLLDGEFAQLDPQVSPDGRWLAYQSDESGRFEIYVRPYPDVQAGRRQVSAGGGTSPRWSRDGGELFFVDEAGLLTVPISAGQPFTPARPRRLFSVKPFGGRLGADFEVAPDGQRFLFIMDGGAQAPDPTELVFVQHWSEELRSRLTPQ